MTPFQSDSREFMPVVVFFFEEPKLQVGDMCHTRSNESSQVFARCIFVVVIIVDAVVVVMVALSYDKMSDSSGQKRS